MKQREKEERKKREREKGRRKKKRKKERKDILSSRVTRDSPFFNVDNYGNVSRPNTLFTRTLFLPLLAVHAVPLHLYGV